MSKLFAEHDSDAPASKDDCGCAGAGACKDVVEVKDRNRRSLMVGGTTVAVVATLINRRAFANSPACGPISRAGSANPSTASTTRQCGGLTPGYWKNHAMAVSYALGGGDPGKITLGNLLSALSSIDSTSAGQTFTAALCNPSSNASHWACAILNASTPGWNPSYGYTVSSLNHAILAAYNNGIGAKPSAILTAIKTLENDYGLGTVSHPYNTNVSCCKS
jgi:hypothetical protein